MSGLLADGAHLAGHSSGAVAAMLAAVLRPRAVLSLTLCEPPAFQLAPGSAEARQMARDLEEHLHRPGDDAQWLRGFLGIIGRDVVIPDQLPLPSRKESGRSARSAASRGRASFPSISSRRHHFPSS